MHVRTRIPPSPTGEDLHIGSVYTALINYAVAKKMEESSSFASRTPIKLVWSKGLRRSFCRPSKTITSFTMKLLTRREVLDHIVNQKDWKRTKGTLRNFSHREKHITASALRSV